MLIVSLAIDAYRGDHAHLPESMDQLIPNYIKNALDDPFGTGPLVYRRNGDDKYVLYSVGYNGTDDGGILVMSWGGSFLIEDVQARPQLDDWSIDIDQGDYFLDQWTWASEQ